MNKTIFFVGTYSQRGGKGIYTVEADPETGAMQTRGSEAAQNPSFLALSPNGRFLFAIGEVGEFSGKPGGGVSAFAITDEQGALSLVNAVNVRGNGPCHVAAHPGGEWLVVSCYGDGTHAVVPVSKNGQVGEPTDLVFNTGELGPGQKGKHAHCAIFSPDGKFVYTCDLGLDRVSVYAFDDKKGKMQAASSVALPSGAGPRHFALHPKLPMAYVINELNSTITGFRRDVKTGALTAVQTISTLSDAETAAFKRGELKNSCADIHLSENGEFLYGSNRGADSIAVFRVDRNGTLKAEGAVASGGKTPRNFALLPAAPNTGEAVKSVTTAPLLVAANQNSDNIVVFRREQNGKPVPTGATLSLPAPVCVLPWNGKKG